MMVNWTKYNVCRYAGFYLAKQKRGLGGPQCLILKKKIQISQISMDFPVKKFLK